MSDPIDVTKPKRRRAKPTDARKASPPFDLDLDRPEVLHSVLYQLLTYFQAYGDLDGTMLVAAVGKHLYDNATKLPNIEGPSIE